MLSAQLVTSFIAFLNPPSSTVWRDSTRVVAIIMSATVRELPTKNFLPARLVLRSLI